MLMHSHEVCLLQEFAGTTSLGNCSDMTTSCLPATHTLLQKLLYANWMKSLLQITEVLCFQMRTSLYLCETLKGPCFSGLCIKYEAMHRFYLALFLK